MHTHHASYSDQADPGRRACRLRSFAQQCVSAFTLVGLLATATAWAQSANTLPTGGQITSGSGSISQSGNQMTVTQSTNGMIAQWGTFNIGQDAGVQFVQPNSSSVALNRILDQNPSQVLGSLTANGQVFLINSNGVYFGKNATVDVGGLVASSLDIADADFKAGKYNFSGKGGSVVNAGKISAGAGGVVALISPVVSNEGTISAVGGGVVLAAGKKVNLNFGGSGMISVTVDEAAVDAQVSNHGLIKADGGVVVMTARAADSLLGTVVNNTGVIEANTLSSVNGRIVLDGGEVGIVENAGTLSATGTQPGETGGIIVVTGEKVGLFGSAIVDASGQAGGGAIAIGGGFQGKDTTIQNASQTVVGKDAIIRADGGVNGSGGKVVLWSNDYTAFGGTISAQGGSVSGNGGSVEVSSGGQLNFLGLVDAKAFYGKAGMLLLDPKDLIVATGGSAVLDGSNTLAFATNTGGTSTIDPGTITAITNAGTAVTLQASNDITINNAIISNNPTGNGGTMTFEAGRSIINNSLITTDNGNITFIANAGTGAGVINADRSPGASNIINNGVINAGSGTVAMTIAAGTGQTNATSGSISSGTISAGTLNINHNGSTAGGTIDLGSTSVQYLSAISGQNRDITNSSGVVSVQGVGNSTATFQAGSGGDITITGTNTDFNNLKITSGRNVTINDLNGIQLDDSTISGNFSLTSHGPIGNTGSVSVAGQTTLAAQTGGFGISDPDINLRNSSNDFNTIQIVTGHAVAIADSNGFTLSGGANHVTASLKLESGNGPIVIAAGAATTAHGTITIDAGGSGGVTINDTLTSTAGSINITAGGAFLATSKLSAFTGSAPFNQDVSISAGGSATLADIDVSRDLTVTAQGNIIGNGVLTQMDGVATFTAANGGTTYDITLNNANNDFDYVRISNGKNVSINDKNDINFYEVTATGDLSVAAGGSISSADTMTVTGDSTFTTSAANSDLTLANGNNVFTGSVTMATTGSGSYRDLNFSNNTPVAAVISGFPSNSLRNVTFTFNSAPNFQIPTMILTGDLSVNLPSATVLGGGLTQANGGIKQANGGTATFSTGWNGDITLNDAGNTFTNLSITSARNATITNTGGLNLVNGINLANSSGNGDLTLTVGGDITQTVGLQVKGTAEFIAGNHDVLLNTSWNSLNILKVTSARNVNVIEYDDLVLDTSNISGTLTLQGYPNYGNSQLTQIANSAVHVGGDTTFSNFQGGQGINLPSVNNIFGDLAISGMADRPILITENDAITQSSAWNLQYGGNTPAVTLTTVNDQAIMLNKSGNYLGNLTMIQNGPGTAAGVVSITNTNTNGITQGAAWQTHGNTTVDSSGRSVTLTDPDNVLGPLQVLGGTSGSSTINIVAKDNGGHAAIRDFAGGAWTTGTGINNTVTLTAYSSGGVFGGGDINLTNTGNVIGDLTIYGNNVTITEGHSITDVGSGNAAGQWTTTGTTTLNSIGSTVSLDNTNNVLGPLVVNGSPTSVLITDNSNITQAAAWHIGSAPVTLNAVGHGIDLSTSGNVLGAINITVTNGMPSAVSITEDDAITQGSAWIIPNIPVTLNAENGKAITLTQASNQMGSLTVTGGVVSITENDSITQGVGAWTTTGTTTLNPTGNNITLTNVANLIGPLAISNAAQVNITNNADITQASAWTLPDAPITLNAQTHDVLLTQSGNQLGDLKITGQNAQIVENHDITDGGAWSVSGLTTLTAGTNSIVLDANPKSDFGTLKIISAADADVSDLNGIIIDGATVSGTFTLSAGGAITQTANPILTNSLVLGGTGASAVLNTATNDVTSLSTNFTAGGGLSYTDANDFDLTNLSVGANAVSLTSVAGTVTGLNVTSSSTSSLTVNTGTGLIVPALNIAGSQDYTAGGTGILLDGNLNSTAAGAINFHSPVALNRDLTISSTNAAITFDSAVAGNTHNLGINAGSSAITFDGAVSNLGNSATSNAALSVTATSGSTIFNSTLSANNGLLVSGPSTFKDSVTLQNGGIGSTFTGEVTLGKVGGMTLSGYKYMDFNSGISLANGDAAILSNGYPIRFNGGSVHGPFNLTLDAGSGTNALIGGSLGLNAMGSDLTGLTVGAYNPIVSGVTINGFQDYTAVSGSSIQLGGSVTSTAATTGTITFHSPVNLTGDASLTTSDADITFASKVDGAHNLVLDSGLGAKAFTGKVGNITAVGDGVGASITLQGSGATVFSNTVNTRSGIVAAGPVTFAGNVTMGDGDTGSTFNGLVTTGATTISGYDDLAFNGGLALTGDTSLVSNGSDISFGNTVSGPHHLTLNALAGGAGTVTGLNNIGFTSDLTKLSITAQTLSLPATGLAVAGPMDFTAPGGITLNGAVGNSAGPATGQIDFNSPVLMGNDTTITTSNAAINFASTIDGGGVLSLNSGSGIITINGAVGGSAMLGSLLTTGTGGTVINGGGIETAFDQVYGGDVTIGNVAASLRSILGAVTFSGKTTLNEALTVNTNSSGDITFNGAVDGANALVVNTNGTAYFNAAIGGVTPLSSLVANQGSTTINGGAVTTTGSQNYFQVFIGADAVLKGTNISFDSTLDSVSATTWDLTITDSGMTTLNSNSGAGDPLRNLTFNGGGSTLLRSNIITTGAQTYGNELLIDPFNTTTLTSTGAGDITFNSHINSYSALRSLTVNTAGATIFNADVGRNNELYNLTTDAAGTTVINTSLLRTNQAQTFNDAVTLGAPDVTLHSDNSGLTFKKTIDGASNLVVEGPGVLGLSFNGAIGGTTALNSLSVSGRDISLRSVRTQGTQTYASATNGATTMNGNLTVLNNAAVSFSGKAVLGADVTIAPGGGDITVNNALNGAHNLNLDTTGTITLAQTVGQTTPLTSLTTKAGSTTIIRSSKITTTGSQNYNGAVNVNNTTLLTGTNVTFAGTLDGAYALSVNDSGTTTFGGMVGGYIPLASITSYAAGGTVIAGGSIRTTGNQDFISDVTVSGLAALLETAGSNVRFFSTLTLAKDLTVTTGVGNVTFDGTVDGASNLVVNSSGLTAFSSAVGGTTPLASLTTDAGSGGSTTIAGGVVTTTGGQFYNDALTLGADTILTGDKIDFGQAVSGAVALTLQPFTANRNVQIGGGVNSGSALDLTTAELALLPANLTSLTIGSAAGTGTLDISGNVSFGAIPLTLNGGGGISQTGGTLTQSAALTLFSNGAIDLSNTGNSLGAISINGTPTSVNIADSTDITQGAAWNLGTANTTLNAGTHDIILTLNGNTFGTLLLTGGNVNIKEAASTDLGISNISKNLTLDSDGAVTVIGAIDVTGNAALTANGLIGQTVPITIGGNLSLDTAAYNAGNVTINNSGATNTHTGTTLIGGDYDLITTGGTVSQSNGTNVQVAGNLTINSTNATMDSAGNLVGGTTNLPGTSATFSQSGVITLGNLNVTGNYTIVSTATNRSFSSGAVSGTAINLNNSANHVTGTISVNTVAPSITSGPQVQTGILQSTGTSIQISGNASFTAEASSAGSLGVILNNAGNTFGSLRATANLIDIVDSSSSSVIAGLNGTTSTNLLTSGSVTQTGAIITPALTINSGGAITLTETTNQISNLTLNANGAISYRDTDGFAISGMNANGNAVALVAGGTGAITQTGSIINITTLGVNAGGAVTLTDAGNTIDSLTNITAGGALQIRDSAGGLSISGSVQVASGDIAIRTSGDLTLGASSAVTATTGNIYVSTEGIGNFVNNAGTGVFTVGSGSRWLVYSKTPDLVGSVHTVKGGLTSSFRLYGKTYGTTLPGSVTETGNGFIYSDAASTTLTIAPTITGTASHVYGNTPTAVLGYTVSGGFVDSEDTLSNIGITGAPTFDQTLANTMNAGSYTIKFTGGLSSLYTLVPDTNGVNYSVTPAVLTYNATSASRYYGDANPALGGTITGFKLTDNSSSLGGSISWATLADGASNVGSYAITGGGFTSGNYTFVQAAGNATALSVTARPITLTATNQNRIYGDANPATGGYTISTGNLVNSDALTALLSVGSPALLTSNVGSYALTPYGANFTSGSASNYAITYAPGTLSVTARPITLTANDLSRYYGNANPATGGYTLTNGNLVNSDVLNALLTVLSPATLTDHVGNYTLTPSGAVFTSGSASNYAISYAPGTLSVTARPITLTANGQSRYYGDANSATGSFTIGGSGLANTDALNALLNVLSPATATSNVGSYTLTPSGAVFTSGTASDYAIAYASGTLSVAARPITLTASNLSRYYGNANPATGGYTLTSGNLVNSDALATLINVSSPALLTSNVGGYVLTPYGANFTSGLASNYAITYTPGTLSVAARPITLTAVDLSRIYGNANPTTGGYTITSGNLVNGDAVNALLSVLSPATPTSNVGNYTLTPSGAVFTSGAGSNYAITYALGTLVVTARPITLTAVDLSRLYGNANPTTGGYTITSGNLVNGDAVNALLSVLSPATVTSNVGNYTLTPSGAVFTNGSASNYAIAYAPGTLSVTARPITLTAVDLSRIYGNANPTTGGYTITSGSLVNGDAVNALLSVLSPATVTSNVGNYTLTPSGAAFTSGAGSNYAITYAPGMLAVTARPITLTAVDLSRLYGNANPTTGGYTITSGNLVNGDALNALLSVLSPATLTSNVGNYTLTPSGAVFTSGAGSNYTITYAPGTLSVTARPITLTANNQSRYYGDANSATGSFTIGGSGLANTDALNALFTILSSATVTSNVGSYTLTPSGAVFTNGSASNYAITYAPGTLSVTARPITITATNQSRTYGDANLTTGGYTIISGNLVNSDALAALINVTSPATLASNVGAYALIPGSVIFTAGSSSNYAITYSNGSLNVTPAVLTYTANTSNRFYGDANPVFSGLLSGFKNGETLATATTGSLIFTSPAGVTTNAGSAVINGGGLTANNGNYVFVQAAGNATALTITPRPLTVTAVDFNRYYGDTNPAALIVTTLGLVNGDMVVSAGGTTLATQASNVGVYLITPNNTAFSSGLSSNYAISYIAGNMSVLPRSITIIPVSLSRVYGDANPVYGLVTASNLANGDTLGVSTLSSSAALLSNVGVYSLLANSAAFTKGSASNYAITYAPGVLTVTPRPVTITANDLTKIYGTVDPTLTYLVESQTAGRGLISGQTLLGSLSRAAGENVAGGPYAITMGTLAIVNPNYSITYNGGSLTITPEVLTYVATPTNAFSSASIPSLNGTVVGFVHGDTLGSATTGSAIWITLADGSSGPGTYAINGGGLTANNGNYVFVQAASNATALTIEAGAATLQRPVIPEINTGISNNPTITTASLDDMVTLYDPLVSLPGDSGYVSIYGNPYPTVATMGPVSFAAEGDSAEIILPANGNAMSETSAGEHVPLYLTGGGDVYWVGSFSISQAGNVLSITPVGDQDCAPLPSIEGATRNAVYMLARDAGDAVEIEVSLSANGVLLVKVPTSFLKAQGFRRAALAGILAAQQELHVGVEEIKAINIKPQTPRVVF